MQVLSAAGYLPLQVFGDQIYPEETRLKYRFLDLRREQLHANIVLRSRIVESIRRRMVEQGFTEFHTPILTASSPEGARDFLVPSRLHPGKFYALPQAPQQFKQLIMVAGFDRYFQIAPCFRDEDARADRSPGEFYQLDVEMSFVEQDDVFDAIEPVLAGVFEEFSDTAIARPFVRIPYADAMLKYGTDKPDLRNPLEIVDVTAAFAGGGFGIFSRAIETGAVVRAIPAPGSAARPRSFFDKLNDWARAEGAAGLGYIVFAEDGAKGPIAKNLEADRVEAIRDTLRLGPGRCGLLRLRQARGGGAIGGRGTHPDRRRIGVDRRGGVPFLLGRRFPDVRIRRGNKEAAVQSQPIFDAAGRPRRP